MHDVLLFTMMPLHPLFSYGVNLLRSWRKSGGTCLCRNYTWNVWLNRWVEKKWIWIKSNKIINSSNHWSMIKSRRYEIERGYDLKGYKIIKMPRFTWHTYHEPRLANKCVPYSGLVHNRSVDCSIGLKSLFISNDNERTDIRTDGRKDGQKNGRTDGHLL